MMTGTRMLGFAAAQVTFAVGVAFAAITVGRADAEFEKGGRRGYLMVTMDRVNFPGMPSPNWTYGKLMAYVAEDSKYSRAH